jgi:hypothetical protein
MALMIGHIFGIGGGQTRSSEGCWGAEMRGRELRCIEDPTERITPAGGRAGVA